MASRTCMAAGERRVPYFKPSIGPEEISAVVATLHTDWLTAGPQVAQFEKDFAAFTGARFAIAVDSATRALHLSLEALGVRPGDDVLVPTMTFASAVAVVIHLGACPVFVDCDPETLTMDPDDLERRITPGSKVVMPMHYAGHPCEMDRIHAIAQQHKLRVLEDAAHALPAQYAGKMVGSISDVTCFSFYATKTMTTGEGGMITTSDEKLAKRMRLMAYHGIDRDIPTQTGNRRWWRYDVIQPGYKANMSDIAAAIGIHQLKRLPEFWKQREECAAVYEAGLHAGGAVRAMPHETGIRPAWHMYVVQLDPERLTVHRDAFCDELDRVGVGNSVHYMPLHMHSYYRDKLGHKPEDFPQAAAAYERIISLPLYPGLEQEHQEYVLQMVAKIAKQHAR